MMGGAGFTYACGTTNSFKMEIFIKAPEWGCLEKVMYELVQFYFICLKLISF